eukprot:1363897-Rhodomonas_salina.1
MPTLPPFMQTLPPLCGRRAIDDQKSDLFGIKAELKRPSSKLLDHRLVISQKQRPDLAAVLPSFLPAVPHPEIFEDRRSDFLLHSMSCVVAGWVS